MCDEFKVPPLLNVTKSETDETSVRKVMRG